MEHILINVDYYIDVLCYFFPKLRMTKVFMRLCQFQFELK